MTNYLTSSIRSESNKPCLSEDIWLLALAVASPSQGGWNVVGDDRSNGKGKSVGETTQLELSGLWTPLELLIH
jgi:hypothetical protein